MNKFIKTILILIGSVSILLGIIGIFLPLLPTTPFLLLGAACYFRGSRKLYHRLLASKWLGRYIADYRSGKGIPLPVKLTSIALLWLTIGWSVAFAVHNIYLDMLLLVIAVCVTWHLSVMKTLIVKGSAFNSEQDS